MRVTQLIKAKYYKRVLSILFFVSLSIFVSGQSISPYMYGQNAWMPSFAYGGKFEAIIEQISIDNEEPFNLIRIGGGKFDRESPSLDQYVALINSIRSIGAEPLVQVPLSEDVDFAENLVDYINIEMGLNVKFWCIGNEPDLSWDGKEVDGKVINSAGDVAEYYTARASVMKAVDNTIKLFGPDFSFFVDSKDNSGWHPMDTWQYPLLKNNYSEIWGKDQNGNYYIDYYAFHVYQYVDIANIERKLLKVLDYIETINSTYRDANNQLGWAITETHITTDNDKQSDHDKAWSFYAGQHIAKVFGLGMQYGAFTIDPWSIHESSGARSQYDLGFFDGSSNYIPRSTYHHEYMLSRYSKWNYLESSVNDDNIAQVATTDETGYSILIMNDNDYEGDFTICLDTAISSINKFVFSVNAGISDSVTGHLGAYETQMVFLDLSGSEIGNITYNSQNAIDQVGPIYSGATLEKGQLPVGIESLNNNTNSEIGNRTFLYPNPAANELFIGGVLGNAKIEIIDIHGKIILKESIDTDNNRIQISEMERGLYLIRVIDDKGIEVNRFLKQ